MLSACGYLRRLNLFALTALVLGVAVNMLLIPRLGAVGSAWASLTAQSFMALTQLLVAIRLFRLPWGAFRLPRLSDFNLSELWRQYRS